MRIRYTIINALSHNYIHYFHMNILTQLIDFVALMSYYPNNFNNWDLYTLQTPRLEYHHQKAFDSHNFSLGKLVVCHVHYGVQKLQSCNNCVNISQRHAA